MKLDDSHTDYFTEQPETGQQDNNTITFTESESDSPTPAPRKPWRKWAWGTLTVAILVAAFAIWLHFFNPYVVDARMKCYIVNVEKRGLIFKTYEADIVTEQSITDSTRLYSSQETVSIPDQQLALRLQQLQGSGRLVTLGYRVYSGNIPWRGASKTVITAIE